MKKLYTVTKMFIVEWPDDMEFDKDKLMQLDSSLIMHGSRVEEVHEQVQTNNTIEWIKL